MGGWVGGGEGGGGGAAGGAGGGGGGLESPIFVTNYTEDQVKAAMLRLTDLCRVEEDETAVSATPVSQRVWTSGVMELAFPNHTFSTNVVSSMNSAIRRHLGIDDNVLNRDCTVTVKVGGQSRRCWKTLVLKEATAQADDTAVCFVCLRLSLSHSFSLSLSLSLSLGGRERVTVYARLYLVD